MILRSLARRHNAFSRQLQSSSLLNIATFSPLLRQTRSLHAVPSFGTVELDNQLKEEGIPGLFSPEAYDVAWTQYQQFMVDRLNTLVANNAKAATWKVKDIVLQTAREPSLAPIFNYASMAHNNHFFFSGLSNSETDMPPDLETNLNRSFGSIGSLRDTFLTTAAAMFGPGFVWLVQETNPSVNHPATANSATQSTYNSSNNQIHFRILATYLAGSPYPGAHTRQQGKDLNTENMATAEEYTKQTRLQNTAGSFGRMSGSAGGMGSIGLDINSSEGGDGRRFGGAEVAPVLCVNTWEHCYLNDYGVAGKRAYLANWWDRIDWQKVWGNCTITKQQGFYR